MNFQYIPYIWPLIASSAISLSLGIYALVTKRNAKGITTFVLSMMAVTIWSFANALEMSGADLPTKMFWANVQYFAYCYSPVTLLALCLEFTGHERWIRSRKFLLVLIIPTIIILLVWTNGLHGLMRYDMQLDFNGEFSVISKKYGPAFFIHGAYSHLLNIIALAILMRAVLSKSTIHRKQAAALLMGASLIILPNVLYIMGISPVKRFDITPVFFGLAGIIIAWGIFHLRMFDLVPLARDTLVETMNAGVMLLDLQNRVLDINPAFEKILGITDLKVSTCSIEDVCHKIPDLVKACLDINVTYIEFSINTNEQLQVYEVQLSPLSDKNGILIGRIVTAYEITEKKRVQQELLKQQWKLTVIEERERMARDLHDNLGQVLGFINLQAQGIRQELANANVDIVSCKLDQLVNASQSAHADIRKYISNIRNPENMKTDFLAALRSVLKSFEDQTGLCVDLDMYSGFTGEELEPHIRINVLYIIKEALNNVRKHAEAKNVSVLFSLEEGEICAVIEDDGKGFNTMQKFDTAQISFGLDIMNERAYEIGGHVDIKSVVGEGSRVMLYIPVNEVKR